MANGTQSSISVNFGMYWHIEKINHDYAGVIVKKIDMGEY